MLVCTDAALGLPMITNPRLPSRIRQGLNTESGLDDGVRVRLLIISLTMAQAEEGIGHVEPLKVIPGGVRRRRVGRRARRLGAADVRARRWMEGTWRQIDALATALLAYTLAADLGGFMAAFAAGIVVIRLAEQRPRAPVRCQRNR